MPFIFIPPYVRFVEIIIDHKLIIYNMLHDTFSYEEHEMIKRCARLLELLNDVIEATTILHSIPPKYQ
ncbi:hypothetical protein ABF81_21020 [Enterobacter hormaechei subsp. steigerwaltii]|nr:hypothetical protein ABF81_21020 [Enterobacter hormaechei subsp. steigerwaltii]